MIEVYPNLFVGNQNDYELKAKLEPGGNDPLGWFVVQACKEPYHREALGYTGRAAAKDHAEYLLAVRDNRLILNLVDADNPAYISSEVMSKAIGFIYEHLDNGDKVLVHCNQGVSRSPGIAMFYLMVFTDILHNCGSFDDAVKKFSEMYPPFKPANGILGFLNSGWDSYHVPLKLVITG